MARRAGCCVLAMLCAGAALAAEEETGGSPPAVHTGAPPVHTGAPKAPPPLPPPTPTPPAGGGDECEEAHPCGDPAVFACLDPNFGRTGDFVCVCLQNNAAKIGGPFHCAAAEAAAATAETASAALVAAILVLCLCLVCTACAAMRRSTHRKACQHAPANAALPLLPSLLAEHAKTQPHQQRSDSRVVSMSMSISPMSSASAGEDAPARWKFDAAAKRPWEQSLPGKKSSEESADSDSDGDGVPLAELAHSSFFYCGFAGSGRGSYSFPNAGSDEYTSARFGAFQVPDGCRVAILAPGPLARTAPSHPLQQVRSAPQPFHLPSGPRISSI